MTTESSPTVIPLLQLGLGGVGRVLVEQVLATREAQARHGLQLRYAALADSSGWLAREEGLTDEQLRAAVARKAQGVPLADQPGGARLDDPHPLLDVPRGPALVLDTTAADAAVVVPLFEAALARGGAVVLANKKPLTASWGTWQRLVGTGRVGYEATVGAGLPIVRTLRDLLDTGDSVAHIEGVFSGTLGYVMSEVEAGRPFAEVVRDARARGWTEPDPRDDLSGTDVARKALILARTLGQPVELSAVGVTALFPAAWGALTREQFMARLDELDPLLATQRDEAHAAGQRLRYVATVRDGALTVGPTRVAPDSALGALRGPDNLVAFHTARYADRPLVVQGAGAGVAVTASAVLSDALRVGRLLVG